MARKEEKVYSITFFIFYDNIYFTKTVFLGMSLCVYISIWSSIKENFTVSVFFFLAIIIIICLITSVVLKTILLNRS